METYNAIIKKEFGFLNGLIHVNACSVGLIPKRTQDAYQAFMEKYLRMVYDVNNVDFEEERKKAKKEISKLINAEIDELAYTKNTTEGTSIIASGYPLGEGDNVVVVDQEDEANIFPWVNASIKRGFEIRIVETDGCTLTIDQVLDKVDSSTKIVALSAVESSSGIRLDLAKLSAELKKRGVLLSVDGIQAIGRIDIDVKRDGIDFLSCGGFKGMMSGFGVGFLYCRKDLIPKVIPPYAGSGSIEEVGDGHSPFRDIRDFKLLDTSGRFEGGSFNTLGIILLGESAELINELGIKNIEENVLSLERQLRQVLADINNLKILESGEMASGMLVAYYDKKNYHPIEALIKKYNISMTHRPGYLRMVLGVHNDSDEVTTIAKMFHEADSICAL